jgi:diketogulonate reductase-like aldo/keto reductase
MRAPTLRPTSLLDTVEIASGVLMPWVGLGTYRSGEGAEVEHEVAWGLDLGYRGIDTASLYGNEEGIGHALRRFGIPRDDIFVATKVWNSDQGYDKALQACADSLARLRLDHVDLYLIHWPNPSLMEETWRAMEELRRRGQVRAIGVCNFLVPHLEQLLAFAEVPPAVDQLEHHPRLQQPELRDFCREQGITMQAWAPVMRGGVFRIPELVSIGARHGKTAAQVSIRWILQNGVTTIPKSVHRDRIAENAAVFDFELTAEEMRVVASLDKGERIGPDPIVYATQGELRHPHAGQAG